MSVHLSDRHMHCDKMQEPYERTIPLVFWYNQYLAVDICMLVNIQFIDDVLF